MAARIDQITNAATYGGATATGVAGAMNWLAENQSAIGVLVMLGTFAITVASALYGMYHRHKIREIAERQGFDSLRRNEQ